MTKDESGKPNLRLISSNKVVMNEKNSSGFIHLKSSVKRNELQNEFLATIIHSLNSFSNNASESEMTVAQVAESLNDVLFHVASMGMNNMQANKMRMTGAAVGKEIHIQIAMKEEEK